MKIVCLLCICCILQISCCLAQSFNVRDYGAVADTAVVSTAAFNKAIMACHKNGGGRVVIPAGRYTSGTITLLSNVHLFFESGAVLYASTQSRDFPRQQQPAYRSQKDPGGWYALLYAEGADHISVSGDGTIDGQGDRQFSRPEEKGGDLDGRPRNILFISCSNVRVQQITMRNSGMWNQHYLNCEDVTVTNIRVYNHSNKNNDGIDIDGCRRFVLANSILDSDDDCIVLKSTGTAACEDVAITNCITSSFCNAIKCGTESTGGFKRITISNCIIKPSRSKTSPFFPENGTIGQAGIALEIVDGGIMEGVIVSDIVIEGTVCPIFVRLGDRARKHIPEAPTPPKGVMRDVLISNITAYNTGNFTSSITGVPGAGIENITLSNIRLVNLGNVAAGSFPVRLDQIPESPQSYPTPKIFKTLPAYGLYIRHVKDITLRDVSIASVAADARVPVIADDVDRLFIDHLTANGSDSAKLVLKEVKKHNYPFIQTSIE